MMPDTAWLGVADRPRLDLPIRTEITTPERFLTLGREWRDLVGRALEANVFMEPAVVAAAAAAGDAPVHVLLAWRMGCRRLEGAWALSVRKPSAGLPMRVLKTPFHDHAFLGTPVLDRGAAAEALGAIVDMIAGEPGLPDLVEIGSLSASDAVLDAFLGVCAERGLALALTERRVRPELRSPEDARLAGSRAKALRRRRRRLGELGHVTGTTHGGGDGFDAALQELLALEASGWKGRRLDRGHAVLTEPALAAFFRAAVAGLAADGLANVTALRVDGRAVAMQLTVRSGATAFTWKSAYDERLRPYAPGLLLLQEVTALLAADPDVSLADSCNHRDDGYMAEFWSGRRPVADALLDLRSAGSTAFLVLRVAELSRRRLRTGARNAWRRVKAARDGAAS